MLFDFKCMLCRLGTGRTVPGEGPTNPKLIVVSDYPGPIEAKTRRPMVGSSGVLLRNALKNLVGLDPVADVFYTNVIKCRPDEVDKIGARELTVCRKWLDREMNEVKSPMILVAGDKARQVMLPNLDKPLGKIHGKVFRDEFRNLTMMVTWNPATVEQFIVDPSGARIVMEGSLPWMFTQDMKKLKRLLEDQCGTK